MGRVIGLLSKLDTLFAPAQILVTRYYFPCYAFREFSRENT